MTSRLVAGTTTTTTTLLLCHLFSSAASFHTISYSNAGRTISIRPIRPFAARQNDSPSHNCHNCHNERFGRTRVRRHAAPGPDKGDLYNDDELMEVLATHLSLFSEDATAQSAQTKDESIPELSEFTDSINGIPGIHDWVLEALSEPLADPSLNATNGDSLLQSEFNVDQDKNSESLKAELIQNRTPNIRAIASDVDGTLLSSGQNLHPITEKAVLNALLQSSSSSSSSSSSKTNSNTNSNTNSKIQHFFPATGKSRLGAANSLGPTIGPLLSHCPGVYIQGLYCIDSQNRVVFEQKLPLAAVSAAEELVQQFEADVLNGLNGLSIIGYDGDDLYTTEMTELVVQLTEFYGEPPVQLLPGPMAQHEPGVHKLLLMHSDPETLTEIVRPKLTELATIHNATVTQAVPTMLELLPSGCSKAHGVKMVCDALGIDVERELLAIGDAENDVGMLEMACIGVAVGNACGRARGAADFVMGERSEDGGAGLAIELFGGGN